MSVRAPRRELEAEGWRGVSGAVWERLDVFRGGTAFLAPPLDTVPSPRGNAIYSLVESLAAHLHGPPLVLARWPERGVPEPCAISDRVLYDTARLGPGPFERAAPYRVKRWLTGIGAPYLLAYARRAARACAAMGIETLVIEDMPAFAPVARQHVPAGARLLLHQHNNAASMCPHANWRRVTSSVDGIVFVAHRPREAAERAHGPLQIPSWVVYNGVDAGVFDPRRWEGEGAALRKTLSIDAHETVMLFAGRIVPGKGIAEAAEAFNALARKDCRLIVVGDIDGGLYADPLYSQRIREHADRSGGRIVVAGPMGQAALPAWYAAADIVVVPSTASEGLPKTITEALAMEKPCLISDRGGALEMIRDGVNGWVVQDPVTPASILITMERAISEFRRLSPTSSSVDISLQGMVHDFEQVLAECPRVTHPR